MLSSSMLVGAVVGYGRRAYADCVSVGGSNFECSGAPSAEQNINVANANVTTLPGFSVTTADVRAVRITGSGDLTYTDANASSLTSTDAAAFVLSVQNTGGTGGALSITTNGDITGNVRSSRGIHVTNLSSSTDITIVSGGTVTATSYGISALNSGTGATSVTANGDVSALGTGGGNSGILATSQASGTDVTVTTGAGTAVTGNRYGIFTRNRGTGVLTITTAGDVTGNSDAGIYAHHLAGGSITITVGSASTVTSSGTGATDAAIRTEDGPTTLTVSGTLVGGTGGAVQFEQSASRVLRPSPGRK